MSDYFGTAFAAPRSERDHAQLITSVAEKVVARRMAVPVLILLESIRPLSRIAGQLLLLFTPLLSLFLSFATIDDLCDMLQEEENMAKLIDEIQTRDEARRAHE